MKYHLQIVSIILAMFIVTQIIGLYVVNYYSPIKVVNGVQENVTAPHELPFWLEPPPEINQLTLGQILLQVIPAFVIAISVFFLLAKFKAELVLRIWFLVVVTLALATSLIAFMRSQTVVFIVISLAIAVPLALLKIFKRNFVIHNLTELLIYPGIGAIFVALLSSTENPNRGVIAMAVLLVLISIYDIWAVWHSGIMQKMAKFQVNKLKIFGGFFVPYISKQLRMKLQKMKESERKKKKIKVNIALLGGGDIVFPLIMAGVVLRKFGFISLLGLQVPVASLIVILGAALGLSYLLFFAQKKKFYPAMPFISAGIFLMLGLCYLLRYFSVI